MNGLPKNALNVGLALRCLYPHFTEAAGEVEHPALNGEQCSGGRRQNRPLLGM